MKNVNRRNASGFTSMYVRSKASKNVAGFASIKKRKLTVILNSKFNDFSKFKNSATKIARKFEFKKFVGRLSKNR